MKLNIHRNLSVITLAGLVTAAAQPLHAAVNLVQNGDFGTGDFSDWNTSISGFTSVYQDDNTWFNNSYLITSGYFALFAPFPGPDSISQTIATIAGENYNVDFLVNVPDYAQATLTIDFGNSWTVFTPPFSTYGQANSGWVEFDHNFTATSDNTELLITGDTPPSYFGLANVSVTVPEPGVYGVLAGLVLTVVSLRKRHTSKT